MTDKTLPRLDFEDTYCWHKINNHNVVNGYYALLLMPLYGCGFSTGALQTDAFSLRALGGDANPTAAAHELGEGILAAIYKTLGGASEIYYSFAERLLVARVCLTRQLWSASDQGKAARLEGGFKKASGYLQKAIKLVRAVDAQTALVLEALYDACLVETDPGDCYALFETAFT